MVATLIEAFGNFYNIDDDLPEGCVSYKDQFHGCSKEDNGIYNCKKGTKLKINYNPLDELTGTGCVMSFPKNEKLIVTYNNGFINPRDNKNTYTCGSGGNDWKLTDDSDCKGLVPGCNYTYKCIND